MSLLRIEGLGHRYGARRALHPLDLVVDAGEAVAVLGPSGCGKSTLLQAVAGLLEVGEGRIQRRWSRLGVMFQHPRLLPWRSALDNLALGLRARGIGLKTRRATAYDLGARVGLSAADLALHPDALSGGMQSRVALARALAVEPDMLLLDEPFAALDLGLRHELGRLLLEERTRLGCGMLMITHDPAEALRLADRLVVLEGQPGHVALTLRPARRAIDRDEGDVLSLEAALRRTPAFREAFGLPGDPPGTRAPSAIVAAFGPGEIVLGAPPAAEGHAC